MSATGLLNRAPLAELALSSESIASPLQIKLPGSVFTTNLDASNPTFAQHMRDVVYAPRIASVERISIVALPQTTVFGGGHFVAACMDKFIVEQIPPYVGTLISSLEDVRDTVRSTVEVDGEKLLVGRFGISTWGHWLAELLPKIVLAETAYPGRFSYVLPAYAVDGSHPNTIWSSIAETLSAFGIAPDRVFAVHDAVNYAFRSLFAVTPIWSDHIMHPVASASLRQGLAVIEPGRHHRLAVSRDPNAGRRIANREAVYALLRAHGFEVQTTGKLSFLDQVRAFKGAGKLFGVLGSDLTNLIFSPHQVDVMTAAPDIFGDRFFYALALDRAGRMADLRGPITDPNEVRHKGTFSLDVAVLASALEQI